MKLRIRGNSLRLRLTKTEIADLALRRSLENRVQLGAQPDAALVYKLALNESIANVEMRFQNSEIVVSLPLAEALAWAQGQSIGIYGEEAWGLKVAIEKDFKCLDPRLDEDESDAFENPNGVGHAACLISD